MPEEANNHDTKIAVIMAELKHITAAVSKIEKFLEEQAKKYVTQEEFKPVKSIVYGGVKIVLTAAALGLIALIWTSTG